MKTALLPLLVVWAAMPATAQQLSEAKPAELPPLNAAEISRLYGEPTRVSLDVRDVPVNLAFIDLAKQAGFELGHPENDGFIWSKPAVIPPVTLSFKDVPFWSAVDRVAKVSGFSIIGYEVVGKGTSGRVFGVSQTDKPLGISQTQGLFEASMTSIRRDSSDEILLGEPVGARKTGKQARTNFHYNITFRCDPKLPLVPGTLQIVIPSPPYTRPGFSKMYWWSDSTEKSGWSLSQTLNGDFFDGPMEQSPEKQLQNIVAVGAGLLLLKSDVWKIDDLKTLPKQRVFGERTLTLTSVKVDDKKVNVEVKIDDEISARADKPSLSQLESAHRDMMLHTLALIDSQGNVTMPKMRRMQQGLIFENDLGFTVKSDYKPGLLKFEYPLTENSKPPYKLVWKFPTEIRSFLVPFTWKDLPLP